jgi:hypothetical protein
LLFDHAKLNVLSSRLFLDYFGELNDILERHDLCSRELQLEAAFDLQNKADMS